MNTIDLFKKKQKEIQELNSLILELEEKLRLKENSCKELKKKLKNTEYDCEKFIEEIYCLQEQLTLFSKYENIADIVKEKNKLALYKLNLEKDIFKLKEEKELLENAISEKKDEIVQLNDTILLQEFGIYSPIYDFANSEMYKDRLDAIRTKQKNMILSKTAAICDTNWTVNGSEAQGRAMTNQNIKQILRCFNDECDMLISKVKFNNVLAYIEKIYKSSETLNRMNTKNAVRLSSDYVKLKVEELQLAYEYALKRQKEKEERRAIREQMREEAKLMEEIENHRKEVAKELSHYNKQAIQVEELLSKAPEEDKQHLIERKTFITNRLNELDREIKEMDYREANKRAGYVYVISNIGSFGENVYKIGMTRRLEPMDRVDELGSASVPFKFDVHAMIFSEDAPKLEAALHRAFDSKKVNMVNNRKEFFKVTLEEIEKVIKDNFEKTVEFIRVPNAEQYRETLKIKSLDTYI